MKRTYPTQEDCQMLIDTMNRADVYAGSCSPEFRAFAEKINQRPTGWQKMWEKAFGDKSPWNVRVKFNKTGFSKRELYWDKEKATKLGI